MRDEIEKLSGEINKLLFVPHLQEPIKTLDVPIAGYGYGSHVLPFVFDLLVRANKLGIPDSTRRTLTKDELAEDKDGTTTLSYLYKTRKIVRFICLNDSSSLGLHPALYFYSPDGLFQSATLFSLADWLSGVQSKGKINNFLRIRGAFEEMILILLRQKLVSSG